MTTDSKKTILISKEALAQEVNDATNLDIQESLNVIETLFKVLEVTLEKGEPVQIDELSLVAPNNRNELPHKKTAKIIQFPIKIQQR